MERKQWFFLDNDASVNRPLPPFRYFPLHDLESLWWFAAHFLFTRAVTHGDPSTSKAEPREEDELDKTYYLEHMNLARDLFGPEACRSDAMTIGFYLFSKLDNLHPAVRAAGHMLEESRRKLVRMHRTVGKNLYKIDFHSADGVHEMLRDCFASIAEKFKDADFYMDPVSYR